MPRPTLWEALVVPPSNPFARFEHGLQLPLDAVLPTLNPLMDRFTGEGVLPADPHAAHGWAFAAQRFLESPHMRLGARVASTDPHIAELGFAGVAAFHHAPAPLLLRSQRRFERLGDAQRLRVQLNGRTPAHLDAGDLAFRVAEAAGAFGLSGRIVELAGEALDSLDVPARRRFMATLATAGAMCLLAAPDEATRAYWQTRGWTRPPSQESLNGLKPDEPGVYQELLVIDAATARSVVQAGDGGLIVPASSHVGTRIHEIRIGGCVGGDAETLAAILQELGDRPPAPGVHVHLVPASQDELVRLTESSVAAVPRVRLTAPVNLRPALRGVLATASCLEPSAQLASLTTCVATARAGRIAGPEATP